MTRRDIFFLILISIATAAVCIVFASVGDNWQFESHKQESIQP